MAAMLSRRQRWPAGPKRTRRAWATATNAAVIAAVRVPPSASRSRRRRRGSSMGPSALVSTTARRLRPIRRWISVARPSGPRFLARRRAAGEHGVLGGEPADPLALQERRHVLLRCGPRPITRRSHRNGRGRCPGRCGGYPRVELETGRRSWPGSRPSRRVMGWSFPGEGMGRGGGWVGLRSTACAKRLGGRRRTRPCRR